MLRLSREEEYVFKKLKEGFDTFFDRYLGTTQTLQQGNPTRVFVHDSRQNRLLMEEFRRYLEQRAAFEGWTYEPEKFLVTYVDPSTTPTGTGEMFIANPLSSDPTVFNDSCGDGRFFVALPQPQARKIRDGLLRLVLPPQ